MLQFMMFDSQKIFASRVWLLSALLMVLSLHVFAQQTGQGMPER